MAKKIGNRIFKDFNKRSALEKEWFLNNTWCDNCSAADLGMANPKEYEIHGKIYVEGECRKCGHKVTSEIIDSS